MLARENALKEWLNDTINRSDITITPLAGDASFRRYFRISYNGITQIVMDAPPHKEDLEPFIHIARVLDESQVMVPQILAADKTQGFLLLSDLGDELLLKHLTKDNADSYYSEAIKTIIKMQQCPTTDPQIPAFDQAFMLKEMSLCKDWFFAKYLSLSLTAEEEQLFEQSMNWIAEEVAMQPIVFIHRDYHSRNLMLMNTNHLGVIDFQDAMYGPITYDLVSLLKDCYISWPREDLIRWITYFYNNNSLAQTYSLPELIRAVDLMGIQRHLKVLGVFSRLYLRDEKPGYLKDLPLTLKYTMECAESYKELHPLYELFQKKVRLP